ncbi:MAG: hypothetical protein H7Y15_18065 [Pseudonocardia sp.]|nr:hypothetical protein [Pseudonocardia sp.]
MAGLTAVHPGWVSGATTDAGAPGFSDIGRPEPGAGFDYGGIDPNIGDWDWNLVEDSSIPPDVPPPPREDLLVPADENEVPYWGDPAGPPPADGQLLPVDDGEIPFRGDDLERSSDDGSGGDPVDGTEE